MRHILTPIAMLAALSAPVAAQTSRPVVELYTSQGCSSCPPADRLLAELIEAGDVIALALHVDYWDYIGWVDDLADPAYSARQRAYARAVKARHVFTPQMVIDGQMSVVGSDPAALDAGLAQAKAQPAPVDLTATRAAGSLHISARATGVVPATAIVQVVRYAPSETRVITRGENAGKTITYRNIVTDWAVAGEWRTGTPLELSVPLADESPVVVILQGDPTGPILAAVEPN
ncbi:DUF1223 domain-containing protein [Salipiger sp. IMCC34102]|uniref:DUF1223 domain-containing protein n=1 Tax=Salipiger sp. IMCC34102 TaxID=2510647 RepID=UPI00101CE7DF|nr:DUF1223 domain-containing protein [Salipiger sp. IMCC34102]RYH03304.1 DUF1223 domain-containing protein [Salipiger sp. IMCC34102]